MFLDNSLLVNQQKLEGIEKDITCPICQGILNDPYFCIKCQNNFCYKCISKYKLNNTKCPFRCENANYIKNIFLNKIFSELLKFKCAKECDEVIPYKEVNTHFEQCKKEDFKEKYFESATQVEILKVQIEDYKVMEEELEDIKNEKNDLFRKLKQELDLDEDYDYYDEEYEIFEKIKELKTEIENLREENENLKNT